MNFIEAFDIKAKQLQDQFQAQDISKINGGLLYHFRKTDIALSIIKNRELWFADYLYLQKAHDKDELNLGFSRILECIKQRTTRERDFWDKFRGNFSKLFNAMSVYVLSLCNDVTEKEMWEKYGDIALGFNPTVEQDPNYLQPWRDLYLLKVSYDPLEFDQHINVFLDLASQDIDKITDDISEQMFGIVLASHLIPYIPMLKRQDLVFENEYRLVMPGFYLPDGKRSPCNLPPESFRPKDTLNRTHFAQSLDGLELKEIWLSDKIKLDVKSHYLNQIPT